MKLLIYKIKLAFHLSIFILRLSANFSNKVKPLIVSLFITGLLVLIGGISVLNSSKKVAKNIVIASPPPRYEQLFKTENKTVAELESLVIFWEEVQKVQPQSRDVLLNLSQLYSALQLEEEALNYRNKALSIDPNNPLFK